MPYERLTPAILAAAALFAAILAAAAPAAGAEHHAHPSPPAGAGIELPRIEVPDAALVDQHGRAVNLRDLVAGRRVAMNFIFTTCTTVCPPMGALFARFQRDLETRGDAADAVFLSISIDPAHDTPERLGAWARRFGGSERWRLLTGEKPVVDQVLKDLGVFPAVKEEHAPLMLLGDERSGTWIRASALTPPAELARTFDELPRPAAAQTAP